MSVDPEMQKVFHEEPLPVLALARLIDKMVAELAALDISQRLSRGRLYVDVITSVKLLANSYAKMRDSRGDGAGQVH